MVASIEQLREALAAPLDDGLADFNVYAYQVANPTLPALMIGLSADGVEFDTSGSRGCDHFTFVVLALAGTATDIGAQMILDELIDNSKGRSVKALLEADTTLGGLLGRNGLRVVRATSYDEYATNQSQSSVLGCQFHVEVYAPDS